MAALGGLLAVFAWSRPALAQSGSISGVVRETGGAGIAGVAVTLLELDRVTVAGSDGAFRFERVPAGTFRLEATHMGHQVRRVRVTVEPGATAQVTIELDRTVIALPGISVSVMRPDLVPESALDQEAVRQSNPRDPGELMRALPGVDAVRRGPVGLDPSVRGLRETEVGAYIDGARAFPAGPARMDSQLGHVDPAAIRSIEVVKGPYALTWGAGNLAAVRIETQEVPPLVEGAFHGLLSSGYDANLNAAEASASLFGSTNGVSYWAYGGWRQGDDFEAGDGTVVPADFKQAEGRAKIGFELGEAASLTLNGGFQRQDDIDYPGRLLNADFFESANGSVELGVRPTDSPVRSVNLLLYVYDVQHDMDNTGKPTAEPNPNRTPPFALDVGVTTESTTFGGRGAIEITPGAAWDIKLGGDFYAVNREAVRTVERQDNSMLLFEDQIWPDVTITDVGAFARATRQLGSKVRLAGTARVDFVSADAGRASDFFQQNVSSDLDQSEANLSGALTLAIDLSEIWSLSAGAGSAVRTADALERYSDRFPASKAQLPAEFVGDPTLDPERSTQLDLWLEADFGRVTLDFNGFVRWMDDYITLAPTTLPKRLPLSPDVVFQYINGSARFVGFEAAVAVALTDDLTGSVAAEFLRGDDDELDEPALGVSPLSSHVLLRYDEPSDRLYVEGELTGVAEQDRVASARGELLTEGYVKADLRAGVRLGERLQLRGGVLNVFDQYYVNHLNSKNPFTGVSIPEPGRVFFVDLSVGF